MQVKRANRGEVAAGVVTRQDFPGPGVVAGTDPLFPCCADGGRQVQRTDPGMVQFQIAPEHFAEQTGEASQGGVVNCLLTFAQVVDEQVSDRLRFDVV